MTTTLQAPNRDRSFPTMADVPVLDIDHHDLDDAWELVVQGPDRQRLWTRRTSRGRTIWRHTGEGTCRRVPVRVAVYLTVGWLARGVADLIAKPPAFVGLLHRAAHTCQPCGCTDDQACPAGCSWAAPGLCTACAPSAPANPTPTGDGQGIPISRSSR